MTEMVASELREIIERAMTAHWDLAACQCGLCRMGRAAGCRPRETYPTTHDFVSKQYTDEEWGATPPSGPPTCACSSGRQSQENEHDS